MLLLDFIVSKILNSKIKYNIGTVYRDQVAFYIENRK